MRDLLTASSIIGLLTLFSWLAYNQGQNSSESQIAGLQAEVDSLERQLAERPTAESEPLDDPTPPNNATPSSPDGSTPPTDSTTDPGVVARQDTLDLTESNGWDLDNWQPEGELDIGVDNNSVPLRVSPAISGARLVSVDAPPALETCAQTEGFSTDSVVVEVGSHLCVQTTDGALAALTVTEVVGSGSGARVTFSVTIWSS